MSAATMSSTRHLAYRLRQHVDNDTPAVDTHLDMSAAAAAIDALLDAIEAGGMVQPRQAPQMDLGPLRMLRQWHRDRHDAIMPGALGDAKSVHAKAVAVLNIYFPEGDQL